MKLKFSIEVGGRYITESGDTVEVISEEPPASETMTAENYFKYRAIIYKLNEDGEVYTTQSASYGINGNFYIGLSHMYDIVSVEET